MAYYGQILQGYKGGAIVEADDYDTTETYYFGSCVQFDTTNRRWDLDTALTNIQVGFCIDDTTASPVVGDDVHASGKLPVLIKNGVVASYLIDDGAGNIHTTVAADIGKVVIPSSTTKGRWEYVANMGAVAGDGVWVGHVKDIITINGVTMGVFDFEPRVNN